MPNHPKPAPGKLTASTIAAALTDDASSDLCVSIAFYPGEESAVGSVSPWFCSGSSARLLFGGDSCADCGDDLTTPEAEAETHACEGTGPETVWLYLDPEGPLTAEEVAAWLDCGDPYESAHRVAQVEAARKALLEA